MSLSLTQSMALEDIHNKLLGELCNYAENKIDPISFFKDMNNIINMLDIFIRENGLYMLPNKLPKLIISDKLYLSKDKGK